MIKLIFAATAILSAMTLLVLIAEKYLYSREFRKRLVKQMIITTIVILLSAIFTTTIIALF